MNDLGNFGEIFPDIINNDLLFAGFIAISVLCVLMIFVLPAIDARERVRKRAGAIGARLATTAPQNARTASELQKRRKIIAESLQDVANRNEQKKSLISMSVLFRQVWICRRRCLCALLSVVVLYRESFTIS